MKKLKLFVVSMLAMGLSIGAVSAAAVDRPAYANADQECIVDNVNDLEAAISAKWNNNKKSCQDIILKSGSNITLDRDLVFNGDGDLEAKEGDIVLDLNGHTITFTNDNSFSIEDVANVELKNGTIVSESTGLSAIYVFQGASLKTSKLTINVTAGYSDEIEEDSSAITVSGLDKDNVAKLVTSDDTVISVPYGHGLLVSSQVQITLNGTWNTGLSVIADDSDTAPTKTTYVTFEGGSYTANSGITIPITKGNWIFNGGTFIANNNDALHINAIPTKKDGTKNYEALSVKVNDGIFETKSNMHKAVHSDDLYNIIYGGEFIDQYAFNSEYLAEGYKTYVENGVTYVGLESLVKVTAPTNGTVTADKENAITGQTVTVTLEPDEGYVLGEITIVDKDGKAVEYSRINNVLTFVMPANEVTVTVAFEEKADYTALDEALAKAIEIDPTDYTEESYAALAAAIEKAYELDPELSKAHQDEIDTVTEELNTAIAGLKEVTAESNKPETEIPNTLDSIPVYLAGGAIAIASLIALGYSIKKKLED